MANDNKSKNKSKEKMKTIAGVILFAVFTYMCVYGYVTGEVNDVLHKSVNICLECIGIGG